VVAFHWAQYTTNGKFVNQLLMSSTSLLGHREKAEEEEEEEGQR
jgi:hypothetical protein